jgi:hypothetical protein
VALKNIPDPGFSEDDGSADAALAAALAGYGEGRATDAEVVAALHGARLLVPVVAVLGEAETGPDGLRRDKSSDMAVPTIQAPDGRRALPAFSSTEALARWRPDARPVAVPLRQALQALAHEKADTLLIDLAGPVAYELTGAALRAAGGTDPLDDPAVRDALRAAVAEEPGVVRAHLGPAQPGTDGTLGLVLAPDADVALTARRLAAALAADPTLRATLLQGLDLALFPPGATPPGTPLYPA